MKKINTFEEGLNKLLGMFEIPVPDYRYLPGNADELCDFLVLDKVRIPLLWWRYHEKFYGMKAIPVKIVASTFILSLPKTKA